MKILLLGATGRTGKWILEEAISRNHSVHALVRDPSKVKFTNGRLLSMKNIITLAQRHSINRIVITSAWGVAETRGDIPGWFRWFIEHSNIRYPYDDHAVQEELLKASTLNWTCVRPVGLTNSKKDKTITVTLDKMPKPTLLIPRRMVAKFMLDVVEKGLYIKQMPVISAK